MTALSVPAAATFLSLLFFTTGLPAQTTDAAAPSAGNSKVRIVRLSEVKGAVQVDRETGAGFEAAMPNLPIVEQSRLRTDMGVAEVEFEDNSTLRLAPDSEVEFPQLERLATGATVSEIHLLRGTAYVSLLKSRGNEFTLLFGRQKVELPPASHIRLEIGDVEAKLAVLDGTAHVDGPFGSMDIPRKKTATFIFSDRGAPVLTKNIAEDAFDSWDHTSAEYHERAANLSAFGGAPYAYGLNDMLYYGSFMSAGGCGSMWRPYFAGADWSPYANGAWAYYPGTGYSWVSPYPWGWTPYHYGSWAFCPGAGWGWQPGGTWNGLNNGGTIIATTGHGIVARPPVHPPRHGEPTLTAVNLKPLVVSDVGGKDSFVFRRNSAGLGIPREGLGKLDRFSRSAVQRGTASTPIYLSAGPSAGMGGRAPGIGMHPGAAPAMGPVAIHRGYAPSPAAMSGNGGFSGGFHGSSGNSISAAPVSSAPVSSISAHGGGGGGAAPRGH